MNEISTAFKTLTDKITVKLEIGEKHFNALLCVVLCTLVVYPLLFTAVAHFRTLPVETQLLIATGISVAYSVVLIPASACWVPKEWIYYAPVGILACLAGIYWAFICPLPGIDPNFVIFCRIMIILFPPMVLWGIGLNVWELRHVKIANRQNKGLRGHLSIILFLAVAFIIYVFLLCYFNVPIF